MNLRVGDGKLVIIELIVHNAAYFKQQSGSITLKMKALPWLDGSAPLRCACPCVQHTPHGSQSCPDTVDCQQNQKIALVRTGARC